MKHTSTHLKVRYWSSFLSFTLLLSSIFFVLYVSCFDLPTDPRTADNSTVSLKLSSSDSLTSDVLIADSLGSSIRITVSLKYPEFIDTVIITVFDKDQIMKYTGTILPKNMSQPETEFINYKLTGSVGRNTIIATALINNGTQKSDTAHCDVWPATPKINEPPQIISITGSRTVVSGDLSSLAVVVTDTNSEQILTLSVDHIQSVEKPVIQQLEKNHYTYTWKVPSSANTKDGLWIKVTDNGTPSLSDSEFVSIEITHKKPDAPKNLHIASRSEKTITLAWDGSSRAESYSIFKSDNAGNGFTLYKDALILTTTTAEITDKKQFYYVIAQNKVDISDPSNIVPSDDAINTAPQWVKPDTIKVTLKPGTPYTLVLSPLCSDPQNDIITFALAPDAFDGDALQENTYTCSISSPIIGAVTVSIIAQDSRGLSDTLYITFSGTTQPEDPPSIDKTGPVISLTSPSKDSSKVAVNKAALEIAVTDPSGVALVIGTFDGKEIPAIKGTGDGYSISVEGLKSGPNTLFITATDLSSNANKSTKSFTLIYDATSTDNEGPSITLVNPEKDSAKVSSPSITVTVTSSDPSGVAVVTCTFSDKSLTVTKGSANHYSVDVSGLVSGANTLSFTATDSSSNGNKSTKSVTVIHDPTLEDKEGPVITLVTPESTEKSIGTVPLTVVVSCKDRSGIASISGKVNGKDVTITKGDNDSYSVTIDALTDGKNTIEFSAVDKSSNSNKSDKSFVLVYDPTINDKVGPEITITSPEKDGTIVGDASLKITLTCSDPSGVGSVICTIDKKEFPVTKGIDNNYSATVTGLAQGDNKITFSAIDASTNKNSSTKTLAVSYDPTLNDKDGPEITLKDPAKDGSTVGSSSVTIKINCTDKSGVESVTGTISDKALTITKNADNSYSGVVEGLAKGDNKITFTATDASSSKNKSTASFTVKYDDTVGDKVGPVITLKTPEKDKSTVSSASVTVEVTVTDVSGVGTVTCALGSKTFTATKAANDTYSAAVTGLAEGTNAIVFTATDVSSSANKSDFTVTILYDKTIADNVAPVIKLVTPKESIERVTEDHITIDIECTDDNGIALVTAVNGTTDIKVTNSGDKYSAALTKLAYGKNKVTFTATDKSSNANKGKLEIEVNYNTPIAKVSLEGPKNEASDVELTPTLTWTGGDDPDGDAVFYKVLYGTSATKLENESAEVTKSTVSISKALTPATTYYWKVSAYSKTNKDKQESEVRSFTTLGSAPVIKIHPKKQEDVNPDDKVTFTIEVDGTGPFTYQWKRDDANIGKNEPSYAHIVTLKDDKVNFWCVVSNSVKDGVESNKAQVTIKRYSVTYDLVGGKGNVPSSLSYAKGESFTVTKVIPTKTDNTFKYWTDGSKTYNGDAEYKMESTNVTLKAEWEAIPKYSVTYDKNGATSGSVPKDDATYEVGKTVNLLSEGTLKKDKHTFEGWSTSKDGSKVSSPYTMKAENVTFYAIWKEVPLRKLTITAENGNVTKNPDGDNFVEGTVVELKATADPGWKFDSWSGGVSGKTNTITVTMDDDKAVTAKFTQITYKLTVSVVGEGKVTPSSGTYPANKTVTLTAEPSSGSKFVSWSGGASGSTNPLSITMSKDMNITAIFKEEPKCIITFNEGTGPVNVTMPSSREVNPNTEITLPDVKNTDRMYEFIGWNTVNPDYATAEYQPGELYKVTSNVTFYATWTEADVFTLYFEKGNIPDFSKVDMPETQYHYKDALINLPILTDDADEYDFMGWKDENGNSYRGTSTFQMPAHDATLTAQWAPF